MVLVNGGAQSMRVSRAKSARVDPGRSGSLGQATGRPLDSSSVQYAVTRFEAEELEISSMPFTSRVVRAPAATER